MQQLMKDEYLAGARVVGWAGVADQGRPTSERPFNSDQTSSFYVRVTSEVSCPKRGRS